MLISYQVEKMKFEMFCKARNWIFVSLGPNPKNEFQRLATCLDEDGHTRTFLIVQEGYYFECLPGKKTVFTPYALEGE